MLRYLTAGESHGKCLVAILEGMVAGLKVEPKEIDKQLARRQGGIGRGARMKLEKDKVKILSGLRKQKTIGSPIAMTIDNKDFSIDRLAAITKPRPGHADLAGGMKFAAKDLRDCLERSSARETAARVAVGTVCRIFLKSFGIGVSSRLTMLGGIYIDSDGKKVDSQARNLIKKRVSAAKAKGDTLGGAFEVIAKGVPAGLGSFVQHDRRLDALLALSMMSIQAEKAGEIGSGIEMSVRLGSQVHDEIFYSKQKGFYRLSNNAGGLEGGVTNGEPVIITGFMKPISTLGRPLSSVDIKTKRGCKASVQRHDVCAVEACGVVAEAAACLELAKAMLEKFGGDSLTETLRNCDAYRRVCRKY